MLVERESPPSNDMYTLAEKVWWTLVNRDPQKHSMENRTQHLHILFSNHSPGDCVSPLMSIWLLLVDTIFNSSIRSKIVVRFILYPSNMIHTIHYSLAKHDH